MKPGIDVLVGALRALPQQPLWVLVSAALAFQALRLFIRWLGETRRLRTTEKPASVQAGPVESLRRELRAAQSSDFAREAVVRLLRDLAVDVVSLRRQVSEHAAQEMVARGMWTRDGYLLEMLQYKGAGRTSRGRRKREGEQFLGRVEGFLDRLQHDGRAGDSREEFRGS